MKTEKPEPKKAMQKLVLESIISHIKKYGYPPTVREIGKMVGLKSAASVYHHLKELEEQGFIINDGSPRAIYVVGWEFVKKEGKDGTAKDNH